MEHFIRTVSTILSVVACLLLVPAQAPAGTGNMNYQGYLTDAAGLPVSGPVNLTVSIYDAPAAGNLLWSDTVAATVTGGLFSIELGSVLSPLDPAIFNQDLWLGIAIGADPEMTPRKPLSSASSAFYAFNAGDAATLGGRLPADLDQSAHVVDTNNPHAVTAAQVGADAYGAAAAVQGNLDVHTANQANPHAVTAAQVGAVSTAAGAAHMADPAAHHVKTTSFADLVDTASDAQIPAAITRDTELALHTGDLANPHQVTAAQTGAADPAAPNTFMAGQTIQSANAFDYPLIIKGDPAQLSPLQAWTNSLGVPLASVAPNGSITAPAFTGDGSGLTGITAAQVGAIDQAALDAHALDTNNPHAVTAAQVNADAYGSAAAVQGVVDTHINNVANPHHVTSLQVSADPLGSAEAVQANLSLHQADIANPHAVTAAQAGAVSLAGDTMTGSLGIGRSPYANLDVYGQAGVVFSGKYDLLAPTPLPASGAGTRMMWLPERSAFRVGTVSGNQWDAANIGFDSIAMGRHVLASGVSSTALGSTTIASASYSTALGSGAHATGLISTAMGYNTTASGPESIAMGFSTIAGGGSSTAIGYTTTASGDFSTAMGSNTIAGGISSTAMGNISMASGSYSTAMGFQTTANGINSTAMGNATTASGTNSTAMGLNSTASGIVATAMGNNNQAIGNATTAMGYLTKASGNISATMGYQTTASGYASTAIGRFSLASGDYSVAMGDKATAPSYAETAIGAYNTIYTPADPYGLAASDRLFVIGNGNSIGFSDALVVYKSGDIAIGNTAVGVGDRITVDNGAHLTTAGVWTNASSRALKDDIRELSAEDAKAAFDRLEPVRYVYRNSRDEEYVGFIAEDVPELVAMNDRKSLSAMDIVAVLTKVMQEQKAELASLRSEMAKLKSDKATQLSRIERLEGRIEMLTRAMAAGDMARADETDK